MTPYQKIQQDYVDKRVLIFGLGIQGRGVQDALFFAKLGAKVTVTDLKPASKLKPSLYELESYPITYVLGRHQSSDVLNSDIIIRNPSVPFEHPLLELARGHHIPIHSDETLFFQYAKPEVVGITGTRGKTTTTLLIYSLLQTLPRPVILAGNAVHQASLSLLSSHHPDNLYVFELSSWQLQLFHSYRISPQISVMTNIYPDHLLDRDLDSYATDKTAIFTYQKPTDLAIFNKDNPFTFKFSKQSKTKTTLFSATDVPTSWKLQLPGQHNLENIAAAIQVAKHFDLPPKYIQSTIESFPPVPYRLEPVATINGIHIINDTTSTTPIALIQALNTYPNSILIMGGSTKKLPTKDMIRAINSLAKAVVLLDGSGTQEIINHLDSSLKHGIFNQLDQALSKALSIASTNDILLFSPGFTSFGLFDNEFDRGRKFNQLLNFHQSSK